MPRLMSRSSNSLMPISKHLKRNGLTPRQQRFVGAYLETLNASQAAREAGYKGNRAHYAGRRYKANPAIKAHIEKELSRLREADVESWKARILNLWETISTDEKLPIRDRLRASELAAKYAKLLEEAAPVVNNITIPIHYDTLPATAKE